MNATTINLRAAIEFVNACEDNSLEMTADEAAALRDRIVDEDLTDDAALAAYELLHFRAVHGRAF